MHEKKVSTIHKTGILQWQSYRVLEEHLDRGLTQQKLSAPEWKTLGVIYDACSDGIRSLHIAKMLGVKPPLVTRILESLETKKLVSISTVKEDGRVRMVRMTKKGKEVFLKASESVEEVMKTLLQGVSPGERKAYKSVLLKILENGKKAL